MNGYELSRTFWDFAFSNPEKIRPSHCAVYFFAIEHCNRLGWKHKFGFPSQMVMEAVGVKNWRTYSKTLSELVEFGFIEMIETSKNQYSSNIIAIVKNTKANTKALDKALQKHSTKQGQSIVSIDKQETIKPLNNKTIIERKADFKKSFLPFLEIYESKLLNDFFQYWTEHGEKDKKMRFEKEKSFGISRRLSTWKEKEKSFAKKESNEPKINRQTKEVIESNRNWQ